MWLYPGPSCPDCPFSEELNVTEVDSWVHKVLDLWVNPNSGAGPAVLQEGVANVRVSTLYSILVAFMILSFHWACGLPRGLEGGRGEPCDVDSPKEKVRREVKRASDE
jgi:hypothetical protein